ncbi:MAG: ribose 5-phosphate isomerase B [Bacteroidales bacterium]|nr:ribose 5-phosphate isomerase B [Bacteroidales bacterium]
MKVLIASDHAGFELKEQLKQRFQADFDFEDLGTFSNESVDYPDFAHKLAEKISDKSYQYGVLICGTGNGMAMSANKHADIRAGLCWSKEIAALVRQHNNANILVMPARFIPAETAYDIFETFFHTDFEGGRHQRRIDKINISHGE